MPTPSTPQKHEGISVLIVEDSATQADQLRFFLEKHGFAVTTACNGREALQVLQTHLPSLVISDILMPEINGYELCTTIRQEQRTRHLPVVLLTALSSTRDILLALECQADHFISKPYNEAYLLSRMASVLETVRLREEGILPNNGQSQLYFQGEWFHISTDRQRILDLLISTYESTVLRNRELKAAKDELRHMNLQLELAVEAANQAQQESEQALWELSQRDGAIHKTHKELNLIHRIESLINQIDSQEELLALVSDKLGHAGLFGITGQVNVHLADSTSGEILFRSPLCEKCFSSQQLTVILEAHVPPCAPKAPAGGRLLIPLLAKSKVVGVLCCQSQAGFEPDEQQRELLESLGRQLGMALENIRLYEDTRALALHDPLTGLANRRHLEIAYTNQLARSARNSEPFALLLLDIDHFKQYNDQYGHCRGDELLVRIANLLTQQLRAGDLAARYGGEEFLLLIAGAGETEARLLAERLRQQIMQQTEVTASFGIATNLPDDELASQIRRADWALYEAKRQGRNRIIVTEPSQAV